jgi:hypothetical protein
VWREVVGAPVAGQESDLPAGDLTEEERVARRTVRRLHLDLGHVLQEGVEARATDHTDLCVRHGENTRRGPNTPRTPTVRDGGALEREKSEKGNQAAEDPLEPLDEPELELDAEPEPDDPEEEPDDEDDDEVEAGVLESEDDFAPEEAELVPAVAGALLVEEPRLSLR